MMTINVRLDRRLEALLDRLARNRRRSRSDVVRESIAALARRKDAGDGRGKTPYELMRPFIGRVRAGGSLLAGDLNARIAEMVRKKRLAGISGFATSGGGPGRVV
jgi:Arc/MetJ-type ribon-helix-helix transcriptional regulator